MAILYVRFDIEAVEKRMNTGAYGSASYKVVFRNVPAKLLKGSWVYMGDSAATLNGRENVCIIGVEAPEAQLQSIRDALRQSAEFSSVAADNPLVLTSGHSEPLVTDGYFTTDGSQLSGWAASAFAAVKNEPAAVTSSSGEESVAAEQGVKQRHGCLTTWLVLVIIINGGLALMYMFADDLLRHSSFSERMLSSVISALGVLFAILVFKWKRIGFWGIAVAVAAGIVMNLSMGAGIRSFTGILGIMILYAALQKKKDGISGWDNLT
jgi:hypothetical protein